MLINELKSRWQTDDALKCTKTIYKYIQMKLTTLTIDVSMCVYLWEKSEKHKGNGDEESQEWKLNNKTNNKVLS